MVGCKRGSIIAEYYESDGQLKFNISYPSLSSNYRLMYMSCTVLSATHNARVRYRNSLQYVTVDVTERQPLNASISY
jgi:hypothetical protein